MASGVPAKTVSTAVGEVTLPATFVTRQRRESPLITAVVGFTTSVALVVPR